MTTIEQTKQPDAVIVGAGLAGLACALHLQQQGRRALLIDGADAPGGRIRTDTVDGFLLDRGFQVYLTAYPEGIRQLDLPALNLRPFAPGALIRLGGRFIRLSDPFRRPGQALSALLAPVGSLADRVRIALLRRDVTRTPLDNLLTRPETTTIDRLRKAGFSGDIIQAFFRPFIGGITLDLDLKSSSRMFDFVFRMFASGDGALPAAGMQAIPAQLASRLAPGTLALNTRVAAAEPGSVRFADGSQIDTRAVIIATDPTEAARLITGFPAPTMRGTTCLYYAAPEPPVREPMLVLNGEGSGQINNLCVPSNVAATYAPPGQHLVSVSVIGTASHADAQLEQHVRGELSAWFGAGVYQWRHLRTYRIERALPDQSPPALQLRQRPVRIAPGLVVFGDHRDNASINGALESGRRAAANVLAELRT